MSMSLIVWNCQGLRSSSIKSFILELVHKHKPHYIFLSELKDSLYNFERLGKSMGMGRHFLVQQCGQSGGPVLFEYSYVKLEIIGHTINMISRKLYDVHGGHP